MIQISIRFDWHVEANWMMVPSGMHGMPLRGMMALANPSAVALNGHDTLDMLQDVLHPGTYRRVPFALAFFERSSHQKQNRLEFLMKNTPYQD